MAAVLLLLREFFNNTPLGHYPAGAISLGRVVDESSPPDDRARFPRGHYRAVVGDSVAAIPARNRTVAVRSAKALAGAVVRDQGVEEKTGLASLPKQRAGRPDAAGAAVATQGGTERAVPAVAALGDVFRDRDAAQLRAADVEAGAVTVPAIAARPAICAGASVAAPAAGEDLVTLQVQWQEIDQQLKELSAL